MDYEMIGKLPLVAVTDKMVAKQQYQASISVDRTGKFV
jgi:hypothetical protein